MGRRNSSWRRGWPRGVAPDTVVVASKWGYTYTAGWKVEADKHEVKDHSLPVLRRQSAESRGLLDAHLDLYQIHSATLESGVLDDRAVLAELVKMRAATGTRIGLSLSGPRQAETLQRAMSAVIDGQRVFDCVQATWNLLEPSAGPALQTAHDVGIGVIVKEALANGRLTAQSGCGLRCQAPVAGGGSGPATHDAGCAGPGSGASAAVGGCGAEWCGHG